MQITYTNADGRTLHTLCRNGADGAEKLLANVMPAFRERLAAKGRELVDAKVVADPAGPWTETRRMDYCPAEVRQVSIQTTSRPVQASAALSAPRMPRNLTARQQAEWQHDQDVNEGGEGYNPHRNGSAPTYR